MGQQRIPSGEVLPFFRCTLGTPDSDAKTAVVFKKCAQCITVVRRQQHGATSVQVMMQQVSEPSRTNCHGIEVA